MEQLRVLLCRDAERSARKRMKVTFACFVVVLTIIFPSIIRVVQTPERNDYPKIAVYAG